MNVSMEEKKLEAICRMKKLHIWSQAIKEFEKHGLVLVTEPPIGAVYELEPELREEVKKFEEESRTGNSKTMSSTNGSL